MSKTTDYKFEAAADEKTTAATPAPATGKQTVEVWAERKGMLPEFFAVPAPLGQIPVAPRHNPEFWRFAGARAGSGWPQGAEVTEAEFDAAVLQATTGISR